jgi:hypothetical protein
MKKFVRQRMPPSIFNSLLIDLEDRLRAEALQAHSSIRDNFKLSHKRTRELEGQARFRMMEQGFEDVCGLHGGQLLQGGIVPLTDMKVFQPFMRFEHGGKGFILGLAAMSEPHSLPSKNMSRRAGVTLNYHLSPRLDLEDGGPKIGDIFIMLLVARDRVSAGKIEEIALGVIDSQYENYLFYERLEKYLEGYADDPVDPTPVSPLATTVRLKAEITPYKPPELPEEKEKTIGKKE